MEGGRNPQIRRGQILNISIYKSWVGGQGGEGRGEGKGWRRGRGGEGEGGCKFTTYLKMNLKITMLLRLIFLAQM